MSSNDAKIAIIGSGPSGFFAADAIYRALPSAIVHMFERFPVPYGLVRHGVAPDQVKIKSVVRAFARTAGREQFSFFGNITIGEDLTIAELQEYYDGIILATGAIEPRRLGIAGEDLPGCHTSTEFVCWYNGHPDYSDASFDLSHERAIVIGNGNVALDVARFLAKGADGLRHTEATEHALAALKGSRIKEVLILGRRGPVQNRFTLNELLELLKLEHAGAVIPAAERVLNAESQAEVDDESGWLMLRVWNTMQTFPEEPDAEKPRQVRLQFLRGPLEVLGTDRVEGLRVSVNRLEGPAGNQRAVPTGEEEVLDAGLVIACVGYQGTAIPGVPFDEERCIVPNVEGRIVEAGVAVPGLYAVGWIRHSARGVIGDTKADSAATVRQLVADLPDLPRAPNREPLGIVSLLESKGKAGVDFGAWERMDAEELRRGEQAGKSREKFTRIADMLGFLSDGVDDQS